MPEMGRFHDGHVEMSRPMTGRRDDTSTLRNLTDIYG
jgi:hypothetical protein